MTVRKVNEADAAARFARETANHQMTILHDDGLYRHIRFRSTESSFYWFDLVTWPGRLAFNGDGTSFMFARIEDMFDFFRGKRINPDYWAEKEQTGARTKTYSEDRFRERVTECFVDCVRDGSAPRGLGKALREQVFDSYAHSLEFERTARDALDGFDYRGFTFSDAWEWDLKDWDWWFLWACHGIRWGIEQYDAHRLALATPGSAE